MAQPPKTPDLPPGLETGVVCTADSGRDEIRLAYIEDGAETGSLTIPTGSTAAVVSSLLQAAQAIYQAKGSPEPKPAQSRLISPNKVVVTPSSRPGCAALLLLVGEATIGFEMPDDLVQWLGRELLSRKGGRKVN